MPDIVMATTPQQIDGLTPNRDSGSKRSMSQASREASPETKRRKYQGCSSIKDYVIMSKLGEGTFGEVHKAESRTTGQIVAMKKILMHQEKDGFPVTALREIKLLKMLSHPNVLRLEEMAMEHAKEGRKKAIVYMVTPYMDHDLSGLLENPSVQFTEPQIKCYMLQLLKGVAYLHASKILHRDMKAANLLINNEGILQIADFGLARPYDDPPPQRGNGNGEATRGYTTVVVTRWYRPPELLLQLRQYTPAIDMWGVGCVFGEMFKGRPILPGSSDINQIQLIFDLMGSPNDENMPGWGSLPGCDGVKSFQHRNPSYCQSFREEGPIFTSLLSELLNLNWRKRINAMDALDHPYFKTEPLPAVPGEIPQFQESHELDRRKFREQKANLPPAPAGGTVGMGPDGDLIATGNSANGHGHVHFQSRKGLQESHHDQQYSQIRRLGHDSRMSTHSQDKRGPPPQAVNLPSAPARRPAWAQESNSLPPRPPPSSASMSGQRYVSNRPNEAGRDRALLESSRGRSWRDSNNGPAQIVDTYIPNYARRDDARYSIDDGYRSREDVTRRDERDERRHGHSRDLADREMKRMRSRSPDKERDRGKDRDRDRNQISEKDRYRR